MSLECYNSLHSWTTYHFRVGIVFERLGYPDYLSIRARLPRRIPESRIQPDMKSPSTPPGKRTSFPNPLMIFIIIGIIVVAVAAFLVLRPNPSGKPSNSTASPSSQQ